MMKREELIEKINQKILRGNGPLSHDVADFILEYFQEKPRPSAQERLANILWDDVRGVQDGMEQANLIASDLLRNHRNELLDIISQYESEVPPMRGFGV